MAERKRKSSSETLEEQIEKAQEKVIKSKAAYERATDTLQKLLDKRDERRKEELWMAVVSSNKSYEEILQMIRNQNDEEH